MARTRDSQGPGTFQCFQESETRDGASCIRNMAPEMRCMESKAASPELLLRASHYQQHLSHCVRKAFLARHKLAHLLKTSIKLFFRQACPSVPPGKQRLASPLGLAFGGQKPSRVAIATGIKKSCLQSARPMIPKGKSRPLAKRKLNQLHPQI